MRAIDYLQTLPEVDANRIGCAGLSEGGKRTLYLAALDERLKVAVISGYFCALKSTIQHWEAFSGWDICNYLPGLLQYADYPDIAALIAPRALLIENGTQDSLYPLESVKEAFAAVKSAYEQLGFSDRVDFDLFEGGHKFSGAKAFDWVDKWLILS
jgi:cephalosporin-C deacetylase-like acetyl esterase